MPTDSDSRRRHWTLWLLAAGLSCLVGVVVWLDRVPQANPEQPLERTAAAQQTRLPIEELVAAIAAESRNERRGAQTAARRTNLASVRPAEPRTPPDGYVYPTFERAGTSVELEAAGAEGARSVRTPDWLASPDSLYEVGASAATAGRDWSFGWVRLDADARPEGAVAALTALGVVVEGQAGDLLRVRLPGDPDRLRAVAGLPEVDGLGAQPPSAKLPAGFAAEARGKPAGEIVPVFVTLAAAADVDGRWRAALERLGAVVGGYDADSRSYAANIAYGDLNALTAVDFVVFVEPVRIVRVANDTAVPAMGGDAYRSYSETAGFAGTGGGSIAIGVMDTGLNINHVDIGSGRLSVCGANSVPSRAEEQDLWVDSNGHGTHVTATIAGNGTAEQRYAGMAPLAPHIRFAKVLNSNSIGFESWIFPGMDFLAEASECSAAGWTDDAVAPAIVNMSLGGAALTFEGRDTSARKLDAVVWDTGQLYVVANANANIHGFSQYAAAKNSLAVGAAWDSGELAWLSSTGPTADGRLVPMVVGTGVDVFSASGDGVAGEYTQLSGTSMASPSVAGIAALVMDAQPVFTGRPALTRAHLMASAVKPDAWLDAAGMFPSDNSNGPGAIHARYGLGKVSGSTSVFDRPGDDGWMSGGWHGIDLDRDEYQSFDITVPEGASRLDVVLAWDEPPADVIADTVLNDLDLWLDEGADCSVARCGERSSRSRKDNVEWLVVRNPQPGLWRAKVVAERVHGDSPRAALAYTVIRGSSTPELSIIADSDTLDENGGVTVTVSTDGYVAAGTRLGLECRTSDGEPCHPVGTYEEVRDDVPSLAPRAVEPGSFVALGEIRPDDPRTVRFRGLRPEGNARVHFTVTGWNASGASAVVFATEKEDLEPVAPANDDFGDAAELDGPVEGDLLTATTEPGESAFEDGFERPAASVWYRWQATSDGAVHFSVAPDEAYRYVSLNRLYEAFEMRLDVYQGGSVAGLRRVASAAWGASFFAEQGSEYLLRVAGRARAAPFTLSWRQGVPANDSFDAAVALEGGEGEVEGTNAGATLEPGEQFGELAATVWYEWTAPDDGWYGFSSSAAHLKVLAFRDAATVRDVRLVSGFPLDDARFPVRAGDAYRIAVATEDAEGAGTDFELSWAAAGDNTTPNDLLANADAFPAVESYSYTVGLTAWATVEPGEPTESGVRTNWWSWTAPETGGYTWRLDDDLLHLAAFAGSTLDDLSLVGSSSAPNGEFTFAADEDESYRFAVGASRAHAFASWASGTVAWGPTPHNDAWSSAGAIAGAAGDVAGSNRYATVETGERSHDIGHSSLWWSFEAPAAGWYRFWIDEIGSPSFTVVVYQGDDPGIPPGRLEMIASSEHGPADGAEAFLQAVNAGERFAVRVGTRGDADGGEFTLRWSESGPPAWLRYASHTDDVYQHERDDGETVQVADFHSLSIDGSGRALYAGTTQGVAVFERAASDGTLEFVDLVVGGEAYPLLHWDGPRNRLLAFSGSTIRPYAPVADDVRVLREGAMVRFADDSEAFVVDTNYTTVLAHPTGSFLYFVDPFQDMQVFSVGEDGTMAHVQSNARLDAVAISNAGEHAYALDRGTLRVYESAETGELTETGALRLRYADQAIAVGHDDRRVFTWGRGGACVVDVGDPQRPALLGTIEIPQENWWHTPECLFAAGRNRPAAVDAFCESGDIHSLQWRNEKLVLADLVADWYPSRYNDVVPDFTQVVDRRGFAASSDGHHAYGSTPDGIVVFERVNNATPDDHSGFAAAATYVTALPWSGAAELEWAGDRDVFRIEVDGSGLLSIRTTGSTDTFGTLTDVNGRVLAEDDDSGDVPNFLIETDVEAGTYFVAVSGPDGATGEYTLSIEFSARHEVAFAAERTISTDTNFPASLYAADLDGDGDPDLLSASVDDDKVAWYENLGGGSISAQRVIATDADGAVSVHAADLDGDGDLDVLSASRDDGRVAWYENQGGGSFSAQHVITTEADGAASVHAADLDGDGDADVLSASRADDKIAWYENQGGGSFSAQRVIATDAVGAIAVHAADLDGDGDADVLAGSVDDDRVAWHENLGTGKFLPRSVISTDALAPSAVYAADLDGDGDADVLSASADDDKIAWHENQGGGSFSAQRVITTDAGGAGSVHAADLDGDGDLDVLSTSEDDDKIAWYENIGGGAFSSQRVIGEVHAWSVFAVDLDGDGDLDVAASLSGSEGDKVSWYENLADHGDDYRNTRESATLATVLPAFLHGTMESAGDRDVFRVATGTGTLRVRSNGPTDMSGTLSDAEGNRLASNDDALGVNFAMDAVVAAGVYYVEVRAGGSSAEDTGPYTLSFRFVAHDAMAVGFSAERVMTTIAGGARSAVASDLDGDGDPDVVSASYDDDTVAWYENLGGAGFSAQRDISTAADQASSVHVADFDRDGDLDVLSASSGDGKVAWYENLGGEFSAQRVITTGADGARSVHAADFDGDGRADVLSATPTEVAWYENLGDGFSGQRVIGNGADAVVSVDLDGDGDADALSAESDVAWYENLGAGSFSRALVGGCCSDSVFAADLDRDGDADVIAGSASSSMIVWHENLGGGAFSARRIVTTSAAGVRSVHAADLDGDGDLDVLSALEHADRVAWHENLGGGRFAGQQVVMDGLDDPWTVYAADIDGDGDPDVLSASYGDDKIAWYESLSDHGDDHGDAPESATLATALPAFGHGVLESAGDRDAFRVATGTGTLRVSSNGPTDTYGTLLDADGEPLAINDDAGAGLNFMIETDIAAGVHYVEVRGYSTSTGSYTLSIEFSADSAVGGSLASACGRTPAIRAELVRQSGAQNCAGVSPDALARIEALRLSGAGISTLREGDLTGLGNLRELFLDGNAIGEFPERVFDGLERLEALRIDGNPSAELPARLFAGLPNLQALSLGGPWLSQLPGGIFEGLVALERLALRDSGLSSLPAGVFEDLHGLRELRLDGNALGEVERRLFRNLAGLRILDLRFNRLTALPASAFVGLRLDELHLDGNPGSPFAVAFALGRTDDGDPAGPAPGTVALRFDRDAILDRLPFAVSLPVGAQRGTLSKDTLTMSAGAGASQPVAVSPSAPDEATWVYGTRPLRLSGPFSGLVAEVEYPIALFAKTSNRMPRPVGRIRGHATTVGMSLALHSADPACCEVADVATYFADEDGDLLSYAATSDDADVVDVELAGTRLVFHPISPGRTVVRLRGVEPSGLWAAHEIDFRVQPVPDPGRFDVEVVFVDAPTKTQRTAVREAARRWGEVIVGDLGDIDFSASPVVSACGSGGPVFGGVLDDIRVYVHRDARVPRAGPRRVRADGGLPLDACVWLAQTHPDRVALAHRDALRQLGHGLGFGSLWAGLVRSGNGPTFQGAFAKRAFNAAGGTLGVDIPVADDKAHWRRSWAVYRNGGNVLADVMAAPVPDEVEPGVAVRYAISETTVQSLADLGYRVDPGRADAMPVVVPGTLLQTARKRPQPAPAGTRARPGPGDVWTGLVEVVDGNGNVVTLSSP